MKEMLESVLGTWKLYWGEGFYQYLFLSAAVYLLIFRNKKKWVRHILSYLAVILFVFIFPPTAIVIQKCIGDLVYWRVLWLLPVIPLIALAGTELIKARKTKIVQVTLLLLFLGAVAVCGKGMYQAGNYVKVHNFQKVPDEVAAICERIRQEQPEGEVRLAADDYIASYVRVYDPSIQMPYGRAGRGARGKRSRRLYQEMIAPAPSMEIITRLSKKTKCSFVAVKLSPDLERAEKEKEEFQKRGYTSVDTVNAYTLFKQSGL